MWFEIVVLILLVAVVTLQVVSLSSSTDTERAAVQREQTIIHTTEDNSAHLTGVVTGVVTDVFKTVDRRARERHDVLVSRMTPDLPKYYTPLTDVAILGRIRYDRDKLQVVLQDLLEVLNEESVDTYIAYGTALGLHRDGDFIEWDHDADLGISVNDHQHVLDVVVPKLIRQGFRLVRLAPWKYAASLDSETHPNGSHAAKGFCFMRDNQLVDVAVHVWMPPIELKETKRGKLPFPVFVEDYLADVYGPHWNQPNPKHITIMDIHTTETRLATAAPWIDGPYYKKCLEQSSS